jgi:lipoyl(octanoyl) transferase
MFKAHFLNLEKLLYNEALSLMRDLVDLKSRSPWPEVLIITEHEPVLTMGRRAELSDILVPQEVLASRGIGVHRVERGGLITYHGPGQLVAYPVFDLRTMSLSVGELVHSLEEGILHTLSDFGIDAGRVEGKRGVWVEGEKIASIGIAVRKGISFHGVALNCDPVLSNFELINPCGLSGVRMTSMAKRLKAPVDTTTVRNAMALHFKERFRLDLTECSLDRFYGIRPGEKMHAQ